MIGYHINLFYSEEDKGYIVDIPGLRLGRPLENLSENEIILFEKETCEVRGVRLIKGENYGEGNETELYS